MGFKPSNAVSALVSVRFSAFLGSMYLSNKATDEAIEKVKAELGEAAVKAGFTGISENTASGKARKLLSTQGVEFGEMFGRLTGVRVLEREVSGRKMPYLSVTTTGDDGTKYNLSVNLTSRGAQMLTRKLANAKPELMTDIALFTTYEQKPGRDRAYAEQGASLKQDGKQVPGVDPKVKLTPQIDAAMQALTAAGIPATDKDVRNKRRGSITLDFHVELAKEVQSTFDAYYKERDMAQPELPVPANASQPAGFDDMDDDVPF
jgi:hypothetical protein